MQYFLFGPERSGFGMLSIQEVVTGLIERVFRVQRLSLLPGRVSGGTGGHQVAFDCSRTTRALPAS